jgi:glycosyltransferase involved in cell wall biosynthesis
MSLSISVITPSFNQGQFIERTIQSVLAQKVEVEYMIFDAASTDNTLDILRKYEVHVKWISEPDAGQSDAVNKGIRATKGDIIAWINSDDIYLEEAFMEVKNFFEHHPLIDVVYGNAWYIDINDNIIEPYMTEEWDIDRLKETCFICQPAAFFRRKIVEQFGLLDANLQYCMDYEFWLRLGLGKIQFAYLPKYLAASRLYPENKTLGQKAAVIVENNSMLKKKIGYVPDSWLYSYAFHEAEIMGYSSDKDGQKFFLQAVHQSLRAAWRWNKRISIKMLKQLIVWVKKCFL